MASAQASKLEMSGCSTLLRQLFQRISPIVKSGINLGGLADSQIEELLFAQIQISEILEASDCTRYTAIHTLMKYLNHDPYSVAQELDMILILNFYISLKLHQGIDKAAEFTPDLIAQAAGIHYDDQSIDSLKFKFLINIAYDLPSETPYTYLQNYSDLFQFPINFVDAIKSYINFAISIKSLAIHSPSIMFGGCVLASYETMKETPLNLQHAIKSLKISIPGCDVFCKQILQKINEILENDQPLDENEMISI